MRVAIVFAALVAMSVAVKMVPLEPRFEIDATWTPSNHALKLGQTRELIFAIKQQNLDELERRFWAYSTPGDAEYGKRMTVDELTELVGAREESIAAVEAFLAHHGVSGYEINTNRDMVLVYAVPLAKIERMFDVKFSGYRHVSGRRVAATEGPYNVPAPLADHLDFVSGITGTPTMHKRRAAAPKVAPQQEGKPWWMKQKDAAANPVKKTGRKLESYFSSSYSSSFTSSYYNPKDQQITPAVIRAAYGVPPTLVGTNETNFQAVAEFQAQYYSPSDLATFFEMYVNYTDVTTIAKVIGENIPSSFPSDEANLDTQYIMSVGAGIPTYFYSMENFAFFHDITKWLYKLNNDTDTPWVHSVSYGEQGNYPSEAYRERIDGEFMKLGNRRISVMFASGDSGSGCTRTSSGSSFASSYNTFSSFTYSSYSSYSYTSGQNSAYPTTVTSGSTMTKGSFTSSTGTPMSTSTGTSSYGSESCSGYQLDPSFPATSVYVTAVGATRFINGNSGEEGSVLAFKSGGGFSYLYPRPSYQDAAVSAYLASNTTMPPSSAFNSSNRANPDVSALGSIHFQVVIDGRPTPIGGTSASSPTFSGIISLLNDYQLNNGQPTLGFLNPWIYQTWAADPTAFTDVTSGNSLCSTGSSSYFTFDAAADAADYSGSYCGFYCSPGWDPVTGVGTPNYPALLSNLPTAAPENIRYDF